MPALSIDRFPFAAMRQYFIAKLLKRQQMRQLMQQGNQKRIFIEIAIYADTVIVMMRSVAIIAQNTFSFLGNSKMYFILAQVTQYGIIGTGRQIILQLCRWVLLA